MSRRTLFGPFAEALVAALVAALLTTLGAPAEAQASAKYCRGRTVTVDIGAGDQPTAGDDVILGTAADDVIDAGAGNDVVCGLNGNDQLRGGIGNDILLGGRGNDRLNGSAGDDALFGGRGKDRLLGKSGEDRLFGNPGSDVLVGGSGTDKCDDERKVRRVKSCESGSVFPGRYFSVTMARANWGSGYIQAEIMHQVAEELGYEVSNPAELELSPDLAYNQMAEGEIDFWMNSWYPGHYTWWEGDRADGTPIGDYLKKLDGYVSQPQGMLIDRAAAENYNINSFEDVARSPELLAALDRDGNGVAEIYGCPTDWRCDEEVNHLLDEMGWTDVVFEQLTYGYDAMFAEAVDRIRAGEPTIYFTWGPSPYDHELPPGQDVLWLGFENPPSPFPYEGGPVEPGQLPAPKQHCVRSPCFTGIDSSAISPTANTAFLEAHPAIARLLDAARIPTSDASAFQYEQANGDGSQRQVEQLAATWIRENRRAVDRWLNKARTTG